MPDLNKLRRGIDKEGSQVREHPGGFMQLLINDISRQLMGTSFKNKEQVDTRINKIFQEDSLDETFKGRQPTGRNAWLWLREIAKNQDIFPIVAQLGDLPKHLIGPNTLEDTSTLRHENIHALTTVFNESGTYNPAFVKGSKKVREALTGSGAAGHTFDSQMRELLSYGLTEDPKFFEGFPGAFGSIAGILEQKSPKLNRFIENEANPRALRKVKQASMFYDTMVKSLAILRERASNVFSN